jgi:hypothetical protein
LCAFAMGLDRDPSEELKRFDKVIQDLTLFFTGGWRFIAVEIPGLAWIEFVTGAENADDNGGPSHTAQQS